MVVLVFLDTDQLVVAPCSSSNRSLVKSGKRLQGKSTERCLNLQIVETCTLGHQKPEIVSISLHLIAPGEFSFLNSSSYFLDPFVFLAFTIF